MKTLSFERTFDDGAAVAGVLHQPDGPIRDALALTHGAGGDKDGVLLKSLAAALTRAGWAVLRCDLPYRQLKRKGPPSPSGAARDREGLRRAAEALREVASGRVFLGGSSYGGRQASMLAAEAPDAADGLLLLSYPLHPPGKPERMRTAHFPKLRAPALFVHGTRDAFGSIEEMNQALPLIAGRWELLAVEGAAHGLAQKRDSAGKVGSITDRIVAALLDFAC